MAFRNFGTLSHHYTVSRPTRPQHEIFTSVETSNLVSGVLQFGACFFIVNRGSSVSTVTRLRAERLDLNSQQEVGFFIIAIPCRPALGPT